MAAVSPLDVQFLRSPCTLTEIEFDSTAQLAELEDPGAPGQERAREAVEFGVGLRAAGYNLFVLGPIGVGKQTLARELVQSRAAREQVPTDWVYVNNFAQPHRPRALRLPRGGGIALRTRVRQFREDARASIPALFDSDEYRSRAEQIDSEISEQQHEAFQTLGEEAQTQGVVLIQTPGGFSMAPSVKDEVMTPEQFSQLPEERRAELETILRGLQERLQKVIRQVQHLQKEKRNRIKDLGRQMCATTVAALLDDVRAASAGQPEVIAYLDEVSADVLENLDQFRSQPEREQPSPLMPQREEAFFRRYDVNVLIGDDDGVGGAPVVVEDNPTYVNLVGRIEYSAWMGALSTDFSQVKPGALHRANGGYLLLDARRLLTQPFAWDALKRALRTREIRIESLGQAYNLVSTTALEPEPIPLDVKVILFGERLLYYLLLVNDPEFAELFRVPADFEDEVTRTPSNEVLYARLIAGIARREGWRPLDRAAVAHVIEQSARWAGDARRLSTRLEDLTVLLREADHRAVQTNAQTTTAEHVRGAVEARRRRSGRVREKVYEAIQQGELMISTQGGAVGQVNGLSVTMSADQAFAFPTRITANTRMGDGNVVDIQREVDLSGPIHSKGVLIISSLLATRYSPDRPPSLAATLVFEQTYGGVDGDSASVAELCALLSSLGGFELNQGFAITGAIDQHGRVLPIGAVNEKIEGFFDVCLARGLTGEQGVVIPATNVPHLMLREDVVEAVRAGTFRVFAISTLDDALTVLSGLEAGEPDDEGSYLDGTANALVAARLRSLAEKRQQYMQEGRPAEPGGQAVGTPTTPEPAPEPSVPEPRVPEPPPPTPPAPGTPEPPSEPPTPEIPPAPQPGPPSEPPAPQPGPSPEPPAPVPPTPGAPGPEPPAPQPGLPEPPGPRPGDEPGGAP